MGLALLVGCARGGFRVPSAECDREGRARRGEALVWWQCCSQEGMHRAAGLEKRLKRRKQQPEMEGPGVARRMRLEIVDGRRVR